MRTIVKRNVVNRKKGYLYYITGDGHVGMAKAKRGGSRGHRTCKTPKPKRRKASKRKTAKRRSNTKVRTRHGLMRLL